MKLYPVESNELKENSAYCELQKSAEFWDLKLLWTPPSKGEFSMTMRTNKKMASVVVNHINPPTERWTWEPSKPCQIRFSFVDASSEKSLQSWTKVEGVLQEYRQCLHEQILPFRTSVLIWVLINSYIHLWICKAKDLSLSPLFTNEQSLGTPVLSKIYEWVG